MLYAVCCVCCVVPVLRANTDMFPSFFLRSHDRVRRDKAYTSEELLADSALEEKSGGVAGAGGDGKTEEEKAKEKEEEELEGRRRIAAQNIKVDPGDYQVQVHIIEAMDLAGYEYNHYTTCIQCRDSYVYTLRNEKFHRVYR